MNQTNSSGWFYGSNYHDSNADVYVYPGLDDPTTIADASVFVYCDSSSETCPSPYGSSSSAWAQEGDTVFFRGVNGKYGAWKIENIYNDPTNSMDYAALDGTWYFQDDGTGNFSDLAPIIAQWPMEGTRGTTFEQWGTGFTPNSTVTLKFKNHLGDLLTPKQELTDAQGGFSVTYKSPSDKPIGTHTWWAVDDTSGRYSRTIGYEITGTTGVSTGIPPNPGNLPGNLPLAQVDNEFGTLTRLGSFDNAKETFVIVHGWNTGGGTLLPGWMALMGSDIRNSSSAQGANVYYWNWQEKARNKNSTSTLCLSDNDGLNYLLSLPCVPYNMVEDSGKWLASALRKALPDTYNHNIHLIGHSLGTGVITYATQWARKVNYHYKNNIKHLVFLDSPYYIDPPAEGFLKKINDNDFFFDNYWSMVGRFQGYWESDTNVYLYQSPIGYAYDRENPHSYSHKWYRSSVTNFRYNSILGDSDTPSQPLHYGFDWWDKQNRSDVSSAYLQNGIHQYELFPHPIEEVMGFIVDGADYTGEITAETWQKLNEYAGRSKKKVTLVAVNTYNTISDTASYIANELNHVFHQAYPCAGIACGALKLEHQSESMVSTKITIPTDANALTFGYEFTYADAGGTLELIIEDISVFHAFSHQKIGSGYQRELYPYIAFTVKL